MIIDMPMMLLVMTTDDRDENYLLFVLSGSPADYFFVS